MNILYIGPYKHNRCLSYASLDIIETLNDSSQVKNLTIRPIFLKDVANNNSLIINNLENKELLHEYDCIIQHAPINYLCDMPHMSKKNIAIPILENIVNKDMYSKQLENLDTILVDSIEYKNLLIEDYGIKNVQMFGYSKLYNSSNVIDFYQHNNNIKMYWIGTYDPALFDKIITSFYLAFHDRDDVSLMLFFNQDPSTISDNLNKRLEQIHETLKISSAIHNLNMTIKVFNIEELSAIHKSCQVYINVSSSNIDSTINDHIASQNNNKIISTSNLDTAKIPDSKNHVFPEYIKSIMTMSLSENMILTVKSDNSTRQTYPNIVDMICQ